MRKQQLQIDTQRQRKRGREGYRAKQRRIYNRRRRGEREKER